MACRECIPKLLDLAWLEEAESSFYVVDEVEGASRTNTCDARLVYDHYEICQTSEGDLWELGRGAMGITYKAKDRHLGCLVALKIIGPRVFGFHGRDRFLREARTAAGLRHSNIASIHHLGLGESGCYYAMEYIDGETLDAHVRRTGALPYRTALTITLQAARALRVAHDRAFIHRDIKPANLMLVNSKTRFGAESEVKVIDFGLVKTLDDEDSVVCHGYFAGTPQYASPEQLNCGVVDARSDIYSLGACLQYMLTGQQPAARSAKVGEPEGARLRADANLRLPSLVPNCVVLLLRTMVAADPALRPQNAQEVVERVLLCLEEEFSVKRALLRRPWSVCATAVTLSVLFIGLWWHSSVQTSKASKLPMTTPAISTATLEARVLYAEGNEHRFKLTKSDNQRAIECYLKAIALCPDFADAHAALASAYLQNVCRYNAPATQRDEALASAQRAITLDPHSPAGFTAMGEIRTIQGMHWVALAQYYKALELNPQFAPAMRGFSLLWSAVGQPQRGLVWAEAAVKIEPNQAAGWNAAAGAHVDLCADEQAEGAYKRCLEINPAWIPAHCGLVHLHLLQGQFARARQDYLELESIDSNLLLPLTLKAQIALFSGEYSEAETLYRQLLTMKKDGLVHYYSSISYLSALGYLRCRAGDGVEGDEFLEAAAALHLADSEGPQAMYDLAAIRSVQGKTEESLALLQQAISSGWMDYRVTRLDPRFEALRGQTVFERMLDNLRDHVEQMRKEADLLRSKPLNITEYRVQPTAD